MSIKKAFLAGISATGLLLISAACQHFPAVTPGTAPTPTPAIRPEEWAIVTEERPLHEALIAGSRADIAGALDEGADVNAMATMEFDRGYEVSGITPLHLVSVLNDDPEVAALLLDRGADIEAYDGEGTRPLHWQRRLMPTQRWRSCYWTGVQM